MSPARKFLSRDRAVLVLYLLLALVFTYPLVAHLDTHGPGHGVDDPSQTWSLWWVKFAIFDLGVNPLYSDYVFYPVGLNLVAYTPTFLHGLISIPLQLVLSVVLAQNLLVWFALVAGGYGTFLFVREILSEFGGYSEGQQRRAAALAGAIYAFGAWHLNYVVAGHFMLLSNEWIPFFALYLVRLDRRRWRNGVLAGLFAVLATWTELTFAPFLAILGGLYLLFVLLRGWAARARRAATIGANGTRVHGVILSGEKNLRHPSDRTLQANASRSGAVPLAPPPGPGRVILNFAVLAMVAAVGALPLALNLLADIQRYGYYLTSGVGRIEVFSAEPISFFFPSAQHPFLGAWAGSLTNANTSYAFIGYAVLILAVLGAVFHRRSPGVLFWAAIALFFALLMLGPTLIIGGESTGIPLPFALLRAIPFVNANRYPVRFNVMLMLALMPLVALGALGLLRTRRGTWALGGLIVLLILEQLVLPIPLADLRAPDILRTIRDEPGDFAVLDLPLGWRGSISLQGKTDDKAQFYQTVHQKRILGGITSRTPAFKFQYFLEAPVVNSLVALESGREIGATRLEQDRAAAPEVLRFFNIRYIQVNRALADPRLLQYALDIFPIQEIYRDDTRILYRVTESPPPLAQADLHSETASLYFDDGWGRVQTAPDGSAYRWAARGEVQLWLPLASASETVHFRLRGVRAGQSIAVEVNEQRVGSLTVTDEWQDYALHVPAAVLRDGLNAFRFSTETAAANTARPDNYVIGDTGVAAPVDIAATGAGFDAGRFGEIYVASRSVITSRRGYHLVAIDPRTGRVDRTGVFDTFADPAESARLADFVAALPEGEIVAGVAVDEVSRNLQAGAVQALQRLGVEGDLRFQFRAAHAFIGVKGALPGQALERVDGRVPANVAVGKNIAGDRIAFALGNIQIDGEATR